MRFYIRHFSSISDRKNPNSQRLFKVQSKTLLPHVEFILLTLLFKDGLRKPNRYAGFLGCLRKNKFMVFLSIFGQFMLE